MESLIISLVETRIASPMSCAGHAAYLVKSGKNRSCFERKGILRREPP